MITDERSRYLGAAIGRDGFLQSYIKTKVDEWMGELKKLAVFVQTQPKAAYSAYVMGLRGRWAFLCRAMKVPEPMFQPLEDIVKTELIPALTCRAPPGDTIRRLVALPCRLGGLGLIILVSRCQQYESSVSENLVQGQLHG